MKTRAKEWTTLNDIRKGAVFETKDGTKAVKSKYKLGNNDPNGQWSCILLASGEQAHFPEKNETVVRQIIVR